MNLNTNGVSKGYSRTPVSKPGNRPLEKHIATVNTVSRYNGTLTISVKKLHKKTLPKAEKKQRTSIFHKAGLSAGF
jgi:hypothetical protein